VIRISSSSTLDCIGLGLQERHDTRPCLPCKCPTWTGKRRWCVSVITLGARNRLYGNERFKASQSQSPHGLSGSHQSLLCCYLLARLARCHTNTHSSVSTLVRTQTHLARFYRFSSSLTDRILAAPWAPSFHPYNSSLTASPAFCADSRARLVACVAPSLTASAPFSAW